jgi:hypothetical protein
MGTTSTTTRRGLFATAGFAGIAIVVPVAALPVRSNPKGVSAELAALINAHDNIAAECQAFSDNVSAPTLEAAEAQANALPDVQMTINEMTFWTSNRRHQALAAAILAGARDTRDAYHQPYRSFLAAAKRRDRNVKRVHRVSGADAANVRQDAMYTMCANAQSAVAAHPVTNAADLHAKLAFMVKHDMGDGMDWTEELFADAARIAGVEA